MDVNKTHNKTFLASDISHFPSEGKHGSTKTV